MHDSKFGVFNRFTYLDELAHANNYVHMLHDTQNGEVEAVYAWAEIDSPEGRPPQRTHGANKYVSPA